jgi:hypothetical protein
VDAADGRLESKDVYARIEVHDLLRISAGQLKKPFSRLRMSSPFDLVIPERGLLDRYAVRGTYYGGYGGRDIGVMLSGVWEGPIKLRYYLGAFNNRLDDPPYHRDYVARLQLRVIKGLTVGANVSHKRYDEEIGDVADPDYQVVTRGKNLFGADLRLTIAGFRLDLEGAYGDNAGAAGGLPVVVSNGLGHTLYGAHATVSYRLALGESLTLVPALVAEVFDPNDEQDNDDVFRWAAALSAHIGKHVCVALAGERVDRSESYAAPTNVFIQLSLEL